LKGIFIFLSFAVLVFSCKNKNIHSVRLPVNQKGVLSNEKINYRRAVQLRYDDKTLFFSSLENMLSYIEGYNWNLLKAGVKKAYIADYDKSLNKSTEKWINLNVAFLAYIKNKKGKRIIMATDNPSVLKKYKILKPDWKNVKPLKDDYFTFIELIRELRKNKNRKQ